MDYLKINQKIDELTNSGLYDQSQIEAIKYACYTPTIDENLIMNPSIKGDMMLMYIKLAQTYKIDISKYINNKYHQKGFNSEQLYYLIAYDSKGYDISKITPNMSLEQIKSIMDNMKKSANLNQSYNNSKMSTFELNKLKEYNLDYESVNFLLKKGQEEDLTGFLSNNLSGFSSEQIKYLYSVYSTGSNIKNILNPNLTL